MVFPMGVLMQAATETRETRREAVPAFYRAVTMALAGRIVQLGLTMMDCDHRSGLQDGYTAKLLHPDTPSGRVTRWQTIQHLVGLLYPHGVQVVLVPIAPGEHDPASEPQPNGRAMQLLADIASGIIALEPERPITMPSRRVEAVQSI
jgi:hypothetical protein